MQKKRTGAMAVSIILVIVAMIIGLVIGFMIGKSYRFNENTSETKEEVVMETSSAETMTVAETETESKDPGESETIAETQPADADVEPGATQTGTEGTVENVVVTVGTHQVPMSEVNVRLYALRDYYIQGYGEEPWDKTLDNGMTVSEEAKQTLQNDIIRAEVFMDKAESCGVVVTDDIRQMCADEAAANLANLGEEVVSEFGLTEEAMTSVYLKAQVITEVTNVLNDQFREQLMADPANAELDEGELETMIAGMIKEQEDEWFAEYSVSYSDIWNNIIVGSVG